MDVGIKKYAANRIAMIVFLKGQNVKNYYTDYHFFK
jgi:hypothetical protein